MPLYWLSFCDPEKPKGQSFLGVAVVDAPNYKAALKQAWDTGCNPGGEVMGERLGDLESMSEIDRERMARLPLYTLLSMDDILRIRNGTDLSSGGKHDATL